MTARGDITRERLLDAAERLYGERGVGAVSLREIRLAAGQRNSSALQFHFGDRDALLLALTERHLPRLAAIQQEMYDGLRAAGGQHDLRSLIETMIRPSAEYVRRGPGERAWIKISAELSARPETRWRDVIDHAPAVALEVGAAVHDHLVASLPTAVAADRIRSVGQACLHLCADRARLEDSAGPGVRRPLAFEVWAANLVDMAVGAMTAPVGAPALRRR
ncbi:MAG TPA: TetR family transcriptional regulator [Acidimicrobiales bacterium]|nr:TetR family transcriptional regulator [Acidimicrobiales bacterium]